jgi:dolichol-phosphate mannosyltransferase
MHSNASSPEGPRRPARVAIIIPTLEEAETVAAVLDACRPHADQLLVVDGGSKDGTAALASTRGARVQTVLTPGKGAALRAGAAAVEGEFLVFIDADGSHEPADIPRLIAPLLRGEADLVIASRLIGGSSELHGGFDEFFRLAGSAFITACINKRFGVCLSDSQNGFRAIRASAFAALGLTSRTSTIEQEMLMRALALGYRVTEIGSHEYRRKGGVSKIRVLPNAHRYLWSLVIGLLRRP